MHKRIACINNRGYTYPGHLAPVIERLGYQWEMVAREDLRDGVAIEPDTFAAIFSLGSWADPDLRNPEVRAEFDFIDRAVSKKVPVIRVCFGAELLALHDGGEVYSLKKPMVGYYPVILKGSPWGKTYQFFWNGLGFSALLEPKFWLKAKSLVWRTGLHTPWRSSFTVMPRRLCSGIGLPALLDRQSSSRQALTATRL
jgi:hypothetical protein